MSELHAPFGRLAFVLLARAAASIALSGYLLTQRTSWAEVFRVGAWYSLIDGLLALAASVMLAGSLRPRSSRMLVSMTFTDAVLRVAVGVLVLWVPAIAEVPMTLIALFAAIGAIASVLGAAAVILWTVEHHRHRREHRHGAEALYDPIPIVGMLSIAVGTMLVFDPPTSAAELRLVLGTGGVVLGVAFVISSIGALMSAQRDSDARAEDASHHSGGAQRDGAPNRYS